MLALSFSNAVFSSGPHENGKSVLVNLLNGTVSTAYQGINFDRYPIIPRKLLTSSIELGEQHSFAALHFSPSLVNLSP